MERVLLPKHWGMGCWLSLMELIFRPLRFPFLDNEEKVRDCLARINEVESN
jgi:hypothetical protein